MSNGRVHFEVFVRKNPHAGWALEMATEKRDVAVSTAEDLFKGLDILLDGVHEGRPGLLHVLVDDHDVPPGVARIVGVSSPQASSRK